MFGNLREIAKNLFNIVLYIINRILPAIKFQALHLDLTVIPPWRGGGVLRISSDGGDRRIFLGFQFSIPGFFGVGKFGKYFFG